MNLLRNLLYRKIINTAKDEFGEIFLNRDNMGYESSFSFRVITRQGWMRYLFLKGKVVDVTWMFWNCPGYYGPKRIGKCTGEQRTKIPAAGRKF